MPSLRLIVTAFAALLVMSGVSDRAEAKLSKGADKTERQLRGSARGRVKRAGQVREEHRIGHVRQQADSRRPKNRTAHVREQRPATRASTHGAATRSTTAIHHGHRGGGDGRRTERARRPRGGGGTLSRALVASRADASAADRGATAASDDGRKAGLGRHDDRGTSQTQNESGRVTAAAMSLTAPMYDGP